MMLCFFPLQTPEETLNWVVFYLPDEVRVTETLFMDTSVGQVLSDMGGTLGLWLGLGVLQLFQSFAAFKYNVAKKTSAMIVNHDRASEMGK